MSAPQTEATRGDDLGTGPEGWVAAAPLMPAVHSGQLRRYARESLSAAALSLAASAGVTATLWLLLRWLG